jgi:DNA-binding PadR family transcriptional regulator
MSLAYAILAVLADHNSSGYDLAKQFDSSVGYFWAATHQQIYRELGRMEEMSWVRSDRVEQSDRPNKNVFVITELGRQEMVSWMMRPTKPSRHKEEILIKLFAGRLVFPGQMGNALKQERERHAKQLKTYQAIEAKYFSKPEALPYAYRCQYLTLRQGIRTEQSWLDWCDEALLLVEKP